MSYSRYKAVLIVFAGLFVLLVLLNRPLNADNISKFVVPFAAGLSIWLSLFFFLLYAQKQSIKDYDGNFSPSKLFPMVSHWLIFTAIAYPIAMASTYIIWQNLLTKNAGPNLTYIQEIASDQNNTAGRRSKAAEYYYISSGEKIYYLDEKNQNQLYSPDKSATVARMELTETENKSRQLKLYMLVTSIISLMSGVIVAIFYLRQRKVNKLRQ
jgi:hypothetical protein